LAGLPLVAACRPVKCASETARLHGLAFVLGPASDHRGGCDGLLCDHARRWRSDGM